MLVAGNGTIKLGDFGISRALHWAQEQQVAAVRSAYAEELAALERARLEAELANDPQGLAEVVEQQTEIEDRVGRERLGALGEGVARVFVEVADQTILVFENREQTPYTRDK